MSIWKTIKNLFVKDDEPMKAEDIIANILDDFDYLRASIKAADDQLDAQSSCLREEATTFVVEATRLEILSDRGRKFELGLAKLAD